MTRTELETKDKKALLELAKSLGFTLTPAMSKADLVDALAGVEAPAVAQSQDPDEVEEEAPLPQVGRLCDLQGNLIECPKYRVTIMATEQDKDDAKLSVNGHMILVRRGVEVEMQEPYVEALKAAVITTVQKDPNTDKMVPVQIQRYPFMAVPI